MFLGYLALFCILYIEYDKKFIGAFLYYEAILFESNVPITYFVLL